MPAVSELLVRIDATTESLRRELQRADQQLSGFAKNTDRSLSAVDRNVTTLGQRFQNFNAMLGTLGVGMGAMQAGKWVLQQADAYVQLENKIKVVTSSQSQLEGVMSGLFASAQRYSIELGSQVDLYSRLSGALQHTGISQEELLKLTDTFAAALKAGGATTAEASQAIMQLTQAFRGGKLQAEEMNTLLDTMPDYMNAVIAEVARVNGISLDEARSKIKDFGAEGKINLDILVAAAQNMRDGVVAKVSEMGDTTENAMTRLRNSMTMAGESFKPLIPAVTAFFEDLTKGATRTADQVKQFSDAIGRAKAILEEFLGVSIQGNNPFDALNKAASEAGASVRQTVGGITKEMSRMADETAKAISVATAPAKVTAQKAAATTKTVTQTGVRLTPPGTPAHMLLQGFSEAMGWQSGGFVSGTGGPKEDDILALVSSGEFVVNAAQTRKHRQLLEAINDNKFAKGGVVGYATGGTVTGGPSLGTATKVAPAIDSLAGSISQTFNEVSTRWNEAAKKVDAQRAEAQRRMEAEDKALAAKAEEDRKVRAAAYKPAAVATTEEKKKRATAARGKARADTDKASTEIDRDAERVIDATRTALERYNAEVDRLGRLHAAGKISQDVFNRGIATAKNELNADQIAEAGRIFESTRTEVEQYNEKIRELKDLHAGGFIDSDTMARQEKALGDALNADKIAEAKSIFEETRTSAERYEATMARLKELHAGGFIDSDTFGRAATQALRDMEAAANDLHLAYTNVDQMADELGWTMAQSFEDAVFEGGKLRDVLKGLWDDIQRIVFRQLVTVPLASGITAILGGAMAGVPAMPLYQHGGAVRGPGGVDNVPAMLSAGEFVINPQSTKRHRALLEAINDNRLGGVTGIPRFAAGGFVGSSTYSAGPGQIEIKLENKSATPLRLEGSQQRKGPNGAAMISVMVTDAVKAAMDAGQFDRNMSSRYGAAVQPIGR